MSIISVIRSVLRRTRCSWSRASGKVRRRSNKPSAIAIPGAEWATKVVAENSNHPLAETERLGQLLLRAPLLGDVHGGSDDPDDLAGAVVQRLDRHNIERSLDVR